MEILLATDNGYAPLCGINIQSILENNAGEINFYIMDGGISSDYKNKILSIVKERDNVNLEFIEHENIEEILDMDVSIVRGLTAYSRLVCTSYLPSSIDKIIYMDSDGLVNGSLEEIWQTDVDDYYFGAVLDVSAKKVNRHLNLDESNPHFNSGFMLINLKRWREVNLEKKFLDYLKENDGNIFIGDQEILNVVCNGNILTIHPKYNVVAPFFEKSYEDVLKFFDLTGYYPKDVMEEAIANPVFMHLTIFIKGRPWYKDAIDHPLRRLFENYASHTLFSDEDIYIDHQYTMIWKVFFRLSDILPWSVVCFLFNFYQKFI